LENRRGKDNKMFNEMWKIVETEVEKIEIAKTKRRRKKKRRSRGRMMKEKRRKN